jgi:metal-responsive CopG/Arc/MetJ family transcriptional regulator
MKIKTSVTISDFLLKDIDKISQGNENRSQFIEEAIKFYIGRYHRNMRNIKDFKQINKNYKLLNKEAKDVLTYQVDI